MPLKDAFDRHQRNRREIALIDAALARLEAQLDGVAIVRGKVTKSSDDFPYIEEHASVEMPEPREASRIREKIDLKEKRRSEITQEMRQVEDYIERMPEGMDRQILEMVYLDGMTQQEVGEILNLERSGISKKIKAHFELSQLSHL
ncbi:MAG: sigma factor-like helix-turn-helix DNA-binding protein [[Clostridium] scindens]